MRRQVRNQKDEEKRQSKEEKVRELVKSKSKGSERMNGHRACWPNPRQGTTERKKERKKEGMKEGKKLL